MKLSDKAIDAMIAVGLKQAFGGTDEEVARAIETVGGCDEAQVILRRNGKPVGVLLVADDSVDPEAVRARGFAVRDRLQA